MSSCVVHVTKVRLDLDDCAQLLSQLACLPEGILRPVVHHMACSPSMLSHNNRRGIVSGYDLGAVWPGQLQQ